MMKISFLERQYMTRAPFGGQGAHTGRDFVQKRVKVCIINKSNTGLRINEDY